jgi:3-phenylpropionate/trans-cinnamate dioxygenase ferredoxin reductase subunit
VRRNLGEDTFVLFHLDGAGRLVAASGIGPGTSIAREIGIAERLILARSQPNIAALESSEFSLKKLLRD